MSHRPRVLRVLLVPSSRQPVDRVGPHPSVKVSSRVTPSPADSTLSESPRGGTFNMWKRGVGLSGKSHLRNRAFLALSAAFAGLAIACSSFDAAPANIPTPSPNPSPIPNLKLTPSPTRIHYSSYLTRSTSMETHSPSSSSSDTHTPSANLSPNPKLTPFPTPTPISTSRPRPTLVSTASDPAALELLKRSTEVAKDIEGMRSSVNIITTGPRRSVSIEGLRLSGLCKTSHLLSHSFCEISGWRGWGNHRCAP